MDPDGLQGGEPGDIRPQRLMIIGKWSVCREEWA